MFRKFDDKAEAQIAQQYRDGETLAALAGRYHCSIACIRNVLVRQDVRMREPGRKPFTRFNVKRDLKIYTKVKNGGRMIDVAGKFGLSHQRVSQIVKRYKKEDASA